MNSKSKWWTGPEVEKAENMYRNGKNITEISRHLGRSEKSTENLLVVIGLIKPEECKHGGW